MADPEAAGPTWRVLDATDAETATRCPQRPAARTVAAWQAWKQALQAQSPYAAAEANGFGAYIFLRETTARPAFAAAAAAAAAAVAPTPRYYCGRKPYLLNGLRAYQCAKAQLPAENIPNPFARWDAVGPASFCFRSGQRVGSLLANGAPAVAAAPVAAVAAPAIAAPAAAAAAAAPAAAAPAAAVAVAAPAAVARRRRAVVPRRSERLAAQERGSGGDVSALVKPSVVRFTTPKKLALRNQVHKSAMRVMLARE